MGMEEGAFQPPPLAIALGLAFWADCKGVRQANEIFQKGSIHVSPFAVIFDLEMQKLQREECDLD